MTTIDHAGQVNIAPMGPLVQFPDRLKTVGDQDPGFLLRPYEGSRTFRNLMQTGRATIHLTDDALLIAKAAIGPIESPERLVGRKAIQTDSSTEHAEFSHAVLNDCHRWFAVEVESMVQSPPRYEMSCKLLSQAIQGPFIGFNRAKHAVIEAAILATRVGILDDDDIRRQLESLRSPIDKTAGDDEFKAWELIQDYIGQKLSKQPSRHSS
ncbi:DUF447 family protein [Stieleria sp. JC731]|uniref:DUF447 domain-containing protein n=1 Tax=Pirellulaceae TaxID=2691357 RepID=UPI001E2F7D65|nr:DUF447 domain-containing protein [Stieleria sp. JC731]MCC9602545.1 DUF447 family protein [Stieleria sp. JC731]